MNKFAKLCTVSLLALMLAAPASYAATNGEDGDLTLHDAVSKGVLKNPEYAVVANNKLATNEELEQAKSLWMPSVDFLGETGYARNNSSISGEDDGWANRASLSITQLLFDGGGTNSEIKRQKYRVQSAANRVGEVAEFVALDIVQAYLEVLRQRDLLAIARANVEDHNKILGTIQTGADAGTVTEGDVSQANARVAQAQSVVSSTEESLRRGEALFIQKVGDTPADMEFPIIPKDKLRQNVDDSVRLAITNSPTLAVFESDVNVATSEYEGTGSTLYPRLELQANASTGNNANGIGGHSDNQSVLGVMRWNLYRGGADFERQREFMYRHAQAKERRAQAARQVEKDVRDTWAGMISAAERARQFLDQATANEKVVNVYLDQFSLDRRTLLDVLDSQNELFVSRSNHVNSLYTEMFAVFRVLALEGRLLETMGIPRPREAKTAAVK
ncbi:MAG TPA: TolC family outer membrane protein [Patescibacteria group bacterium]|nr:TolC family outer membrane protein [Patescibacteria group bacterium]